MVSLRERFSKVAAAALIGGASLVSGCTDNPQQRGETAGMYAAGLTYLGAKVMGASNDEAALAGLAVGGAVGYTVNSKEPQCVEASSGAQRTTTVNGRTTMMTQGNGSFNCKAQPMAPATASAVTGPWQATGKPTTAYATTGSSRPTYNRGFGAPAYTPW